jgi:sugar phosphate permease
LKQDLQPTSVRYQVLLIVCTLAVIAYIQRLGFVSSSQPFVSKTLGFSSTDAGWLVATFLMAYALFEMPWGMLADRWGARRLLPGLVLCWSLLLACASLAILLEGHWLAAFLFMLALRLFFGMFQAGGFPVISRIIADWIPRQERGFCQGCIWLSTRLGATVLPLLLHGLIVRCGNWHVPFLILSALGLVWAPLFWLWFRDRPEEKSTVNQAELIQIAQGRGQRSGHGSVPWKRMLGSRSVWALCFVYGFIGFAGNFFTAMLPTYLADVRAVDHDERKWMESLPFLFGAVACLTGGWMSDWIIRRTGSRKWGRRVMGTLGLTMGGALWLSVPTIESRWILGLVLCLIFFCNDLTIGPAWASCADIGERHAGVLGGAMNMTGSVLGAAGQVLAGYLIDEERSALLFTIYAGSYWLGAILMQQVDVTQTLADEH